MSDLSWLNPTPHAIAVYASRPLSPVATQHSLPSGRYPLLGPDLHRLDRTSLRLAHSLDHLAGADEQRRGHVEPERLRSVEVDDHGEPSLRLHWKVSRFLAPKNAIDVRRRAAELVGNIDAVGYQAAAGGKETECVDRRQPILICKRDDPLVMNRGEDLRHHDQSASRFAPECTELVVHLDLIVNWERGQLDPIRSGSGLGRTKEWSHIGSRARIEQEPNPPDARRDVIENLYPFAAQLRLVGDEAGDRAAGVRQACDKATADRIGHVDEINGDCAALLHKCGDLRRGLNEHHFRSLFDNLFCKAPHPIGITSRPAIVGPEVTAVGPAQSLQSLAERGQVPMTFRIIRTPHQHRDLPHALALLRPRRERPRGRRAAEQRYELAAAAHSITSSAMAESPGGISRPSALAALRLITNSNLVDCTTGRSLALAPFKIRPT